MNSFRWALVQQQRRRHEGGRLSDRCLGIVRFIGPWSRLAGPSLAASSRCENSRVQVTLFPTAQAGVGKCFSLRIGTFQFAFSKNVRTEHAVNRLVVIQDMYGCVCNAVIICACYSHLTRWRQRWRRGVCSLHGLKGKVRVCVVPTFPHELDRHLSQQEGSEPEVICFEQNILSLAAFVFPGISSEAIDVLFHWQN